MRGVALVTGAAGGGVGTAAVRRLAEDGFEVIANGLPRHRPALEKLQRWGMDRGLVIKSRMADVTVEEEVDGMFADAADSYGPISVVVNNAAPSVPRIATREVQLTNWRSELDAVLTASFLTSKYAIPGFELLGCGRLIHISSSAAFRGARGRGVAYAAAKAGLLGLSSQLALELAPLNVTSNVIAPSQIDTPRVRRGGRRDTDSLREIGLSIPAGRVGLPEDVANVISFLADDRSSYLTAQVIRVDGGSALATIGGRA